MKIIEKVEGSHEASQPLIVGKDTVYVHSNIRKITIDELRQRMPELTDEQLSEIDLYEYHEIQYTINEYIKIMSDEKQELENQLNDTQLALVELYESVM